jgi:hypothetical protein
LDCRIDDVKTYDCICFTGNPVTIYVYGFKSSIVTKNADHVVTITTIGADRATRTHGKDYA